MPNDFFYPGIPTSAQKSGPTKYTNDNLSERQKLSITKEKSPSMLALEHQYDNEPTTEELVKQAQSTLDETRPAANRLMAAGLSVSNPGDEAAAREESRTRNSGYRDVAESALGAASFVPGPVGVAGRAGTSAFGLYDMATQGPNLSNVLQSSVGALDAIPALRSLREAPTGPYPRVTGQGAEIPYKAMLAEEPQSLRALHTPTPEIDLTDELSALADGHEAAGAFDDSGRMVAPPQAQPDPAFLAHQRSSVAKNGSKPSAVFAGMQETGDGEPFALFHVAGGPQHGSTVSAETLQQLGIPVPSIDGAPASNPRMKSLIQSVFGDSPSPSVSRMTAQEALAGDDEAAKRAVLFGGASSRTEGTYGEYVRPKHRYPIGSGSPRVTPREQAVRWNP
jgi:hypothetical protein